MDKLSFSTTTLNKHYDKKHHVHSEFVVTLVSHLEPCKVMKLMLKVLVNDTTFWKHLHFCLQGKWLEEDTVLIFIISHMSTR